MFRIEKPTDDDLAFFHENGYVAFPAVLTEEGRQGLMDDILGSAPVVEFLSKTEEERSAQDKPHRLSVVPWNDKGPFADRLFDAPLALALLRATIGEGFHFCHSELRVSMRGSRGLTFHQDNLPLDPAEQHKWYVQMLYYPNGFERGDASLWVIPGSHRIYDWGDPSPYDHFPVKWDVEVTAEMLTERYGDQVGGVLQAEELALPPGSLVFLNGRMFHAVSSKLLDSPREMRLMVNYLYKEPGDPHRFTQAIPPEWLDRASPERRRMFLREASAWREDACSMSVARPSGRAYSGFRSNEKSVLNFRPISIGFLSLPILIRAKTAVGNVSQPLPDGRATDTEMPEDD